MIFLIDNNSTIVIYKHKHLEKFFPNLEIK